MSGAVALFFRKIISNSFILLVVICNGYALGSLVVTHSMCPEVVVYTTGSMASTNSSLVSSMLVNAPSAAPRTVVYSIVSAPSVGLIGLLGCCVLEVHGLNNDLYLLGLKGKLMLILLRLIFHMVHLWFLNDYRSFNWY